MHDKDTFLCLQIMVVVAYNAEGIWCYPKTSENGATFRDRIFRSPCFPTIAAASHQKEGGKRERGRVAKREIKKIPDNVGASL